MSSDIPAEALQLRSLVTAEGTVELSLTTVDVPQPGPKEVLVRVEAAPINPSDLGLLFAGADMSAASLSGDPGHPTVTAPIPAAAMRGLGARVGIPMAVGNEGAGVVVAAGESPEAQSLLGRTIAAAGGAMYSQYRAIPTSLCLELPEGTSPVDGASSFVNPMTVLGMVETMRAENHVALVHTAAASNLGQMLQKVCLEDDIPLVNIVRRPEQEGILRSIGAEHVVNSGSDSFMDALTAALKVTGATLAFDAIGGGKLASQILSCMEAAATAGAQFSRYGSSTHKQVYIYGGLDRGATELTRNFGMAWGIGGWLLTPFLQKLGPDGVSRLRRRVVEGLKTTFASTYSDSVTLPGALHLDAIAAYGRQSTGTKYLIRPNG